MPSYRRLQQYAILISIVSVLYNGAEGGISIGFGAESASRALVFFGIQSGIEVASACMVIWRFRNVALPGEERAGTLDERVLRFERIGTLTIGILLLLLALATEGTAIAALVLHEHPDTSNASLIISASALVIMILIWLPKRYLARTLNSSTMAGEATCSLSCIQITLVLFAGSLIYRLWKGGWWVDSATSLILGLLFGWEGWKMVRWARDENFDGGCCSDCAPPRLEEGRVGAGGELTEQYRDICECCEKKAECRAADACVCDDCTSPSENREGCCAHKADPIEKCCTRELKTGRRPTQCTTGGAAGAQPGRVELLVLLTSVPETMKDVLFNGPLR
ncbi:hypothetical protein CALVIDRAFT_529784 [Calocera viscosa TUFC12733]|uniref:Cation efflux protein transmembrane domain-containing protein n=1 Tax=Calocera viscosa (strain TUFC12733) TaxID=1330018 RepID=A0A167IUS9_CALVF|nr:hypothetical protein CALVIDRAFT_529784 [Calocera viscosa TUFC12733]